MYRSAPCEAAALTPECQGRLRRWRSVQGATAPCAASGLSPIHQTAYRKIGGLLLYKSKAGAGGSGKGGAGGEAEEGKWELNLKFLSKQMKNSELIPVLTLPTTALMAANFSVSSPIPLFQRTRFKNSV